MSNVHRIKKAHIKTLCYNFRTGTSSDIACFFVLKKETSFGESTGKHCDIVEFFGVVYVCTYLNKFSNANKVYSTGRRNEI